MREVLRTILGNGLRLILAPDPSAPAVGVSLHYGVGFRSEPEGRTGFAHLFEHLMFEGSERVAPGEHGRLVQAAGGTFNGSTGPDATGFHQTVPPAALERVLFLEADRLRALRVTERGLRKQIAVVKDEIRRNVLSNPYGRFPWPLVSQTLYQGFAHTHDGYGDFRDLDRATVADCAEFFAAYYHPGNCALAICGDIDPGRTAELVARHFADIPARPAPAAPVPPEPVRTGEFRRVHADRNAPAPALALGYRLPDAAAALGDHLAHLVLSALLTDGVSSRLQRALAAAGLGMVTVRSACGLLGGPLRARDPDTFTISAFHPESVAAERIVALVDAELARIASPGVPGDEVRGAVARTVAAWNRAHGRPGERARACSRLEVLFGAAELVGELPRLLGEVTHEQVAAAARRLQEGARALVRVVPDRSAAPAAAAPAPRVPSGAAPGEEPEDAPPTPPPGLPPLAPPRPVRIPALADLATGGGPRVLAVCSPAVPQVALRLRVPLAATCEADAAAAAVLGAMLLRESRGVGAADLERAGWTVVPLADTGQLVLSGNGPAAGLGTVLRALAAALADPGGYDPADVHATRTLIAQQVAALTAHPAAIARAALRRHWSGPATPEFAPAAAVAAVTAAQVEALHAARLRPAGATLVLVGDLDPDRAAAEAADTLRPWRGAPVLPAARTAWADRPAGSGWEVVDRPGAAQVQLRFSAPWAGPGDPLFPALEIANTAFGGYSSARLAAALRDRHRLTYSARSAVEPVAGDRSVLVVSFDVRKEAADRAIEEFHRVVEGVARAPFDAAEFDRALQYTAGRWAAGLGGQDELATALSQRLALGLSPEGIFDHGAKLSAVRHAEVLEVSRRYLTPEAFTGVAVGDPAYISRVKQLVSA